MAPRNDASDAQQAAGIDSFDLPKALVMRLAKSALPSEAKLQKETVAALVRGSTVFINYLAATAQDIAAARSRRTIASADVLAALEVLALGDLVPLLEEELEGYRGEKKGNNKGRGVKGKAKEAARDTSTANTQDQNDDSGEDAEDDTPEDNDEENEPEPQNDDEVEEDLVPDEEEHFEPDGPLDRVIPDANVTSEDEQEEVEDKMVLEKEEMRHDHLGLGDTVEAVEGEKKNDD